ncbi:hypothetical protein VN91_2308 [Lactococcus lactis subsp. lactis]|nr:hypothetical protein VN91_2308 [Lactococcus lactis subsp. lactis]
MKILKAKLKLLILKNNLLKLLSSSFFILIKVGNIDILAILYYYIGVVSITK